MKICTVCLISKPIEEFAKYRPSRGGGPTPRCKLCEAAVRSKRYYDKSNWIVKQCELCLASFEIHKSNSRQRFCSKLCAMRYTASQRDYLKGSDNPNWQGGKHSHELYQLYSDMLGRCTRPSHSRWDSYGGRGIKVCSRWLEDFWNFVEDMGPRPNDQKYHLDRIDNDGHYEPSNCRWATLSESVKNRRPQAWTNLKRNPTTGQYMSKR